MPKRLNTDQLAAALAAVLIAATRRHTLASMTVLAAGAPGLPAFAQEARSLDAVSVVGTGSTRTTASISMDEIQAQVPGVAPQQLLASLPGVNVQTTDPFGLYEFGDSMTIRGFSANQIGVTLDGIPIETFDTREGGPSTRYVSSENLLDVTVSAGSGGVTQPSYHALGGALRYTSLPPKGGDSWSGTLTQTIGSDDLLRSFVRLETMRLPAPPGAPISPSTTRRSSMAMATSPGSVR